MNKIEHLLTCLAEECGEVAKECHKANRFTLDDQLTLDPHGPRGTEGPTNREKIIGELNDLMGVVQLCIDAGILPPDWQDAAAQDRKMTRVAQFMDYAARVGALSMSEHVTITINAPPKHKQHGRKAPYTEKGIARLPCFRCGSPALHQWQICSDGNKWRPLCLQCDIDLNRLVLHWMRFPNADDLASKYALKCQASPPLPAPQPQVPRKAAAARRSKTNQAAPQS